MADSRRDPAVRLAQDLADARRRGETFEVAWDEGVKRAVTGQRADERTAWRAALHATRGAWASAWERRPASVPERALLAIATDREAPEPATIHNIAA
ncbi:MAG: hypothetical protein ACR2LK_08190 [Solirubrobacteraceae bacterium]